MQNAGMNNLPSVAGQLATPEALVPFLIPEQESRAKLNMNYICLQARNNPELQAQDFIDHIRKIQKTGADPELGHIHLLTFKKKIKVYDQFQQRQVEQWITQGQSIYSYHYFVYRAEETGELKKMEVETSRCEYLNPATGEYIENTIVAKATVIRHPKDGYEQVRVYRAYFPEFVKTKDKWENGQVVGKFPTEAWATKPYLMLEKCAIANALRLGFERELSGMYVQEEMTGEFSPAPKDVSPKNDSSDVIDITQNVDPAPTTDQQVNQTNWSQQAQHGAQRMQEHQKREAELVGDFNQELDKKAATPPPTPPSAPPVERTPPPQAQQATPPPQVPNYAPNAGQAATPPPQAGTMSEPPTFDANDQFPDFEPPAAPNTQAAPQSGQSGTESGQSAPSGLPQPKASKRTNALLWSKVQVAAEEGIIDRESALKKLESITGMTEPLAQQLIAQLHNKDGSWFKK